MAYFGSGPLIASSGGTGVENPLTSTLTLAGPLATVGAFGATFTFTGTTAITFPTSGNLSAGFTYSNKSSNFSASTNNFYFCSAVLIASLPAITVDGQFIQIVATSTNAVTVTANGTDTIQICSTNAASFHSNVKGDSILLYSRLSDTTWYATSTEGTWT